MNLPYLVPRVIRHLLPERITRFLLLHSLVIRPGVETSDPDTAVRRYVEVQGHGASPCKANASSFSDTGGALMWG